MIDLLLMPGVQLLVALFLAVLVFAYRKRMGPRWLWVTKEILLWTLIARRIDEIGEVLGVDPIQPALGWVLAWLFLLAVALSILRFFQVGRRLVAHEEKIKYLEELRKNSERGSDWDRPLTYPRI
jgi:hypothetical protein